MDDDLILYGGTYLNKGGAAITYGTLELFKRFGVNYHYIVDPEPFFPFSDMNLKPIYRYSHILSTNPIQSINSLYTYQPFIKCILNTYKREISNLKGMPIWHIGDSPFSDSRSALSVVGQIIALESLRRRTQSTTIIGGVSISFPKTKTAYYLMKKYFKNYLFLIRGQQTFNSLSKLGVDDRKMTKIADFAYQLNRTRSVNTMRISARINESNKPTIALCLREYSFGSERDIYIESVKKLVSALNNEYNIFFIPTSYSYFIPENDEIFYHKVLNINNNYIINIKTLTPSEIIDVFSNFDCIISARLHGAVLATLAGVPTIHIYDSTKSLEVIGEVFGKNVNLITFRELLSNHGKICNILKENYKNKDEISLNLCTCIKCAKENTLEHVKEFLLNSI